MNDIVTEEEQIKAIKDWWKENGTQVLGAGCLVAIVYFGFNWWTNRQETQLNNSLLAYDQYIEAVGEASATTSPTNEQSKTIEFLTDQLVEQHGDTHYAFLANLNTAAFEFRRGEWEAAAARLADAKSQAAAEADIQLVNYRYALVQAQLGKIDEALELLGDANEFFASISAEATGDILLSVGRSEEALSAYEKAIETAGAEDASRVTSLQITADSLRTGSLALSAASE